MSSFKPFHPNQSKVSIDQLAAFLNAELTGDLNEVPGIGPATIERLKNCSATVAHGDDEPILIDGVTSTFGLIGVYLSFKNGKDERGNPRVVGPVEHTQR